MLLFHGFSRARLVKWGHFATCHSCWAGHKQMGESTALAAVREISLTDVTRTRHCMLLPRTGSQSCEVLSVTESKAFYNQGATMSHTRLSPNLQWQCGIYGLEYQTTVTTQCTHAQSVPHYTWLHRTHGLVPHHRWACFMCPFGLLAVSSARRTRW